MRRHFLLDDLDAKISEVFGPAPDQNAEIELHNCRLTTWNASITIGKMLLSHVTGKNKSRDPKKSQDLSVPDSTKMEAITV